ncbi:type II secretion system protein GspM [Hyphobacterium sp. HN65]|uniref:Type II secretion system protein GspM n=1 Tax=Hyphobacterium lacteum TaxID=3116575 RepID=A0ABU7LNV7_9PROT|nr:type II secretion system protein GspM [Hyphobacterium sp. HN65]MEE2525568.1 type II secretion system protein GspM [Hyphobacterium sp. HN65]
MTPELRRMIALCTALAIPLVLSAWLVVSVLGWLQVQTDIEQAEAQRALPPAADPARYLTPGENFAIASSNLQSRLTAAAREAGVTASSVQIAAEDDNDRLRMTLDFQAEGEMENLAELLHALEAGLPALIVEDVRLTPIRRSTNLQLTATVRARREPGGGT